MASSRKDIPDLVKLASGELTTDKAQEIPPVKGHVLNSELQERLESMAADAQSDREERKALSVSYTVGEKLTFHSKNMIELSGNAKLVDGKDYGLEDKPFVLLASADNYQPLSQIKAQLLKLEKLTSMKKLGAHRYIKLESDDISAQPDKKLDKCNLLVSVPYYVKACDAAGKKEIPFLNADQIESANAVIASSAKRGKSK